jgi:hypothetical protein
LENNRQFELYFSVTDKQAHSASTRPIATFGNEESLGSRFGIPSFPIYGYTGIADLLRFI